MSNFLSRNIQISSNVLAQEINGETVLLHLQNENYFSLDLVGTRVWQLLQEINDLQKVFDTLLEEYDVEATELEQDLIGLLEELMGAGLIQIKEIA